MIYPHKQYLSFRALATVSFVLFIPSVISFVTGAEGLWPEYTGVLFHLSILFLVARMDAPNWAKAAGYGWVVLDVLAGIMLINAVAYEIAWPIRLAGHVLAGVWILLASLCARSITIRIVGVITGLWMGGYSFVAGYVPEELLHPTSLFLIVWFIVLIAMNRPTGTASVESARAAEPVSLTTS